MSDRNVYPDREAMDELCEKYGGARVQDAIDFIVKGRDHRGIMMGLPVSVNRIEAILDALLEGT